MNIQIGHDLQNTNKMVYVSLSYRKLNPRQFLFKHPTTLSMLRLIHAVKFSYYKHWQGGKGENVSTIVTRVNVVDCILVPHATHILHTAVIGRS